MRHFLPILLAAALLTPSVAAPAPPLKIPFQRYYLPNGLAVILHEDHTLPEVAVNLWYRVGSKDERPGRTGFAHLFEHLMFMGTKRAPNGDFDRLMEAHGGQNNASTSEDRTNYFESGPSQLLALFLWLEADRLAALPDSMTAEKIALQRDVVKNERRQSYENRPYGMVELTVPGKMYPATHPYHHPVIGSHADLTAAGVEDVRGFFRAHYVPTNASLVIAGDFDVAEAKALVQKYFGGFARAALPAAVTPAPASLKKSERVVLRDDVQLAQVNRVWHAPASFQRGEAESEVLAAVLGHGESSRLVQSLVFTRELASELQVHHESRLHGSLFTITAIAQPGHSAEEVERAISDELAALEGKRPITAEEVERARAGLVREELTHLDSLLGRADALNEFECLFGDPARAERELLARFDHVDPSGVAWTASSQLAQPSLTVVVLPRPATAKKGAK